MSEGTEYVERTVALDMWARHGRENGERDRGRVGMYHATLGRIRRSVARGSLPVDRADAYLRGYWQGWVR